MQGSLEKFKRHNSGGMFQWQKKKDGSDDRKALQNGNGMQAHGSARERYTSSGLAAGHPRTCQDPWAGQLKWWGVEAQQVPASAAALGQFLAFSVLLTSEVITTPMQPKTVSL